MDNMSSELDRLRAALTASGDIVYDWDLVNDEINWLQGSEDSLSIAVSGQSTTGEAFHERIHPQDLNYRLKATTALYEGETSFECEYRLRDAGGEHRWYHDRGVAEFSEDGKPLRLRGTIRKINRELENNARVAYLANYDELTGHYNRSRLRESLDQALYYSTRYRVSGAFLVIGIDNINMVNQAFGYEVADAVIVSVGHRLDRCLRACDVIGRLGGDKFGVVLSNCPAEDLYIAAEKILEVARDTEIETLAGPIHVTVSVGAVTFPESAQSAADAVTKAEIALQNAKRAGRNTWSVYQYTDAQREGHRKNMVIAEQVSKALRENRLVLAFQPIVNTDNLETAMHECLLRMIQPDGTVVQAYEFMPVVEELGLIRLIDRRVLELAHEVLLDHPDIHLAINVSGLTAGDKGWLRQIVGLLRHQPEVARRLTIEITETASLEDVEDCARFVSTLKKMGCRVALDDFGAGYTSFRHLKILSVDMVKIDGSFIRDLPNNPANLIFIRSLLDLARNFNLDTVAECVETKEQTEILQAEGVRYLQGYAFGKPVIQPDWKHTGTDNKPLDKRPSTPIRVVSG